MIRSFIYLLLLIVVFLSGMILGMERDGLIVSDERENEHEDMISLPAQLSASNNDDQPIHVVDPDDDKSSKNVLDINTKPHFTQKIASFLETGVKGFYEIIVEVLYQMSRLFV